MRHAVVTRSWALGLVVACGAVVALASQVGASKPQVESKTSGVEAGQDGQAIRDAFVARESNLISCLPASATLSDKVNALRPLYEEERMWHTFFEGLLYTEVLRGGEWSATVSVDHGAKFSTLKAKFEGGFRITKDSELTALIGELAETHVIRRRVAVQIQEKVLRSKIDREQLLEIYPGVKAAAPDKDKPQK